MCNTNFEFNDIINWISGIGTFISSIIALFALKELIKQRRAMYKPKLFLNEFVLGVKGNPFSETKKSYNFHLGNLHEPVDKNDKSRYSVSAQFFFENIGYGVANKIRYTWNFDFEKMVKEICKINSDLDYIINKDDKSIIITKNNEYFSSYRYNDLGIIRTIDFIKAESIQKNIKGTSIPMIITGLYMDYVMVKNQIFREYEHFFISENFDKIPSPKLVISYEDIAGKKYKFNYQFKINCLNSFNQINEDYIFNTNEEFAMLTFRIE